MPSDNIDRAIKRGTDEIEGVIFEEVLYEGYGPAGVAMIIDVLTDNKTRTVSEIRSCFTRYNGNLASSGSVAWQFSKKGVIAIDKKAAKEDLVFEIALDAGAEDVSDQGDNFEVYTKPENFENVKQAFEKAKVKMASSEIVMAPQSTIHLSGKEAEQMLKLMETLEEFEDVRKVYANFDIDEKEMERLAQQ
jgi:YebC/PmpR family DNA-binding regulatory protein